MNSSQTATIFGRSKHRTGAKAAYANRLQNINFASTSAKAARQLWLSCTPTRPRTHPNCFPRSFRDELDRSDPLRCAICLIDSTIFLIAKTICGNANGSRMRLANLVHLADLRVDLTHVYLEGSCGAKSNPTERLVAKG